MATPSIKRINNPKIQIAITSLDFKESIFNGTVNEYEFRNLMLERVQGKWNDYNIQYSYLNSSNEFEEGYIKENGYLDKNISALQLSNDIAIEIFFLRQKQKEQHLLQVLFSFLKELFTSYNILSTNPLNLKK